MELGPSPVLTDGQIEQKSNDALLSGPLEDVDAIAAAAMVPHTSPPLSTAVLPHGRGQKELLVYEFSAVSALLDCACDDSHDTPHFTSSVLFTVVSPSTSRPTLVSICARMLYALVPVSSAGLTSCQSAGKASKSTNTTSTACCGNNWASLDSHTTLFTTQREMAEVCLRAYLSVSAPVLPACLGACVIPCVPGLSL